MALNKGKANFVFQYDSSWDGQPLLEEIGKYAELVQFVRQAL
jgi:hypothetical protein